MSDLLALADRVEALTGPCRETDCLVAVAVSNDAGAWIVTPSPASIFSHQPGWYCTSDNRSHSAPAYTASLDAAMTLAPSRSLWSACNMEDGPFAQVIRPMPCGGYMNGLTSAHAATPATALTAAALRARAAQVPA